MNKRGALQLSVNFLVIIIICIAVFSMSVYILNRFFIHAETIKMVYDERTEKEIERLLDDGSKVAIPFDRKTIYNGEFKTFGIGVLNILNSGSSNTFEINVHFNQAFNKRSVKICDILDSSSCGSPDQWLQTTGDTGFIGSGVTIQKTIKNNEQEKFLLGVGVKGAPAGTYIFDLNVKYLNNTAWLQYDAPHKLYVEVP